jgi:cation/acetate symporter
VNLAILYGMGLIAAAVVLAFVYMGLCRRITDRHEAGGPRPMIYEPSPAAVTVFAAFVAAVLILSFVPRVQGRSSQGYFAAHGQVHWFVNGVAFAGDYLSAASFLGICGMIAFYGYDGFLYSIGYLAGWVVALFVIAEPLKRLGRFTFADALDNRFHSRGIKLSAALSTLAVSLFYLIPQMVGAGTLVRPLLGFSYQAGVITVGAVVILIVVTAGMVSTTYVQFIKGGLLVAFCTLLTVMILRRGLSTETGPSRLLPRIREDDRVRLLDTPAVASCRKAGGWQGKPLRARRGHRHGDRLRLARDGRRRRGTRPGADPHRPPRRREIANGRPQGKGRDKATCSRSARSSVSPTGRRGRGLSVRSRS